MLIFLLTFSSVSPTEGVGSLKIESTVGGVLRFRAPASWAGGGGAGGKGVTVVDDATGKQMPFAKEGAGAATVYSVNTTVEGAYTVTN